MNDRMCGLSGYDALLTDGLTLSNAALNYKGKRQTQTPADLQKLVFNSDAFENTITVKQAGTLAVCYCAIPNQCYGDNWKFAVRFVIRGPKVNQKWVFSRNIVFRFSYLGHGLTSGDNLRIIAAEGDCTSNNNNPD